MCVDPLLSRLLTIAERPVVEGANELSQRVGPRDPRRVIRRQQQSGRVRGKLADGYPPDITALLQLADVFVDWVIEVEVTSFKGLSHHGRFENLADRCEIEQ